MPQGAPKGSECCLEQLQPFPAARCRVAATETDVRVATACADKDGGAPHEN